MILWPYVRGAVSLQLGAGGDQSLAVLVALVLCEVLDEAASQILGLLFPLSGICVGVAGVEDSGVNTGQGDFYVPKKWRNLFFFCGIMLYLVQILHRGWKPFGTYKGYCL